VTGTALTVAGGALAGLGVTLAVAELVAPPRLDLAAALTRLHPGPAAPGGAPRAAGPPGWWDRTVGALVERLPVPVADLRLLDRSPRAFMVSKLVMAGYGALLPALLTGLLTLVAVRLPVAVPAITCLGCAGVLFFAPDLVTRAQAAEARATFRRAVGCYLDLVALERGADGGPAEALTRAAEVGHGGQFRRIADALSAARLAGTTPWQALAELAAAIGVAELADLAEVIALAGDDGAAVADTLAAKAAALRARHLADATAAANTASEKLTLPGVVLAFGFLVLVCYPALVRVLGPA